MMTEHAFLEICMLKKIVSEPHEGARHAEETIPASAYAMIANTMPEFVAKNPRRRPHDGGGMPKFPRMEQTVTESAWRKIPRPRQTCRTFPTRVDARLEKQFPRVLRLRIRRRSS